MGLDITDGGTPRSSTNKYSVDIGYADDRGNIGSITRNGLYWDGSCWVEDEIDDLTFSYYPGTNRLKDVDDAATNATAAEEGFKPYSIGDSSADYFYDENGNLIFDPSKELSISYNYLNLPQRIEDADCKVLEFTYDAAGMKLRKTVKDGAVTITTQDYVGGIEYRGGVMEAIYHSDGRVYFEDGSSRYEYSLTDHLGNTRLMFSDKNGNGIVDMSDDPETTEVLQESHYYPFGMQMKGSWMDNPGRESKYQYNGKELNQDLGLNWLDYGKRWYDPAIGRFTGVDPISDQFPHVTTYNYAENEPIGHIDLWGLQKAKPSLFQRGLQWLGLDSNTLVMGPKGEGHARQIYENQAAADEVAGIVEDKIIETAQSVGASGEDVELAGDIAAGVGVFLTPFAPEVGIPTFEAGSLISTAGATMQAAALEVQGDHKGAITKVAVEAIPMVSSIPLKNAVGKNSKKYIDNAASTQKRTEAENAKEMINQQIELGAYGFEQILDQQTKSNDNNR